VVRELDALIAVRERPAMCVSDKGTELTSMAVLPWSQERRVEWHYIARGKPQQNAFAESFIDDCATSCSTRRCLARSAMHARLW
jgi:putative transposase